jgi:hypothetical protein
MISFVAAVGNRSNSDTRKTACRQGTAMDQEALNDNWVASAATSKKMQISGGNERPIVFAVKVSRLAGSAATTPFGRSVPLIAISNSRIVFYQTPCNRGNVRCRRANLMER